MTTQDKTTLVPDPAMLARTQLIHLRAQIVRLAHDVEGACDFITGKGGPRARAEVSRLANCMRDIAMSADAVRASK